MFKVNKYREWGRREPHLPELPHFPCPWDQPDQAVQPVHPDPLQGVEEENMGST